MVMQRDLMEGDNEVRISLASAYISPLSGGSQKGGGVHNACCSIQHGDGLMAG